MEVACDQQKSLKTKTARSSPGEVAADAVFSRWDVHDEMYTEFRILCHKKQWGAVAETIASLLAKGRDDRRQYSTKLLPAKRRDLGAWVVEYGLQVRIWFRSGSK